MSETFMTKILMEKHNSELERARQNQQVTISKTERKAIDNSMFNIRDKELKRSLQLNRDILLYQKGWLKDRDFKFFFDKVYYNNIRATELDWRSDFGHLLVVRLMSYHNIGNSFFQNNS